MKKRARTTKAELINSVKAVEKGSPAANMAFEHERLLHELQVHQIELETQNRELREAQLLLENSRDRYADLYDFAPVGYATLDDKGVICEINLTAAGMLGSERTRLVGTPFHLQVTREDLARFREHLARLSTPDERATTELRLVRKGGLDLPVVVQSVLAFDAERRGYLCRSAIIDIHLRKQAEEASRNNEARLNAILETAVEGILTINERGTIELFNPAAARMFGYTAAEVIGQNISLLLPVPERAQNYDYIADYQTTGERKVIGMGREVVGRRKDGSTFPLDFSVSKVQLADRRIFTAILRDITERKQAEEALRRSEKNLVLAQQVAHVGSYEFDVHHLERFHWSAETLRILGLDPAKKELSFEEYLARLVHPEDRLRVCEGLARAINEATGHDMQYRIVRPDGSIRHVHSVAERTLGPDKKSAGVVGSLQDITERKELEKQILEVSEREQSRIGQDLHDGLCQHLAGIEFRLLGLKQNLEGKSSQLAAETAKIGRLIREAIEQTRTLARGLSPVIVAADGLMTALSELAIRTEKTFHTSCSLTCPAPVLIHDNAEASHLYRIAQEAVHNAVRHGKANFIVINLLTQDDRIVLGVRDDGIGFPKKPRKHQGMGLRVMHYRASMVGGSLIVQREPEGGTSVICSLPIPAVGGVATKS